MAVVEVILVLSLEYHLGHTFCTHVSLLSFVMDAIVGRQTNILLLAGIHAIAIYNTDQGHNSRCAVGNTRSPVVVHFICI